MEARQIAHAGLSRGATRPAPLRSGPREETLTAAADTVRIGLVACAGAFLVAGDGAAALKCLLVLGPAIASRIARVPSVFDVAFTVALASEAIGSALAAHNGVEWPDEASHLVIPFLSAPVVYEILVRLDAALVPERAGGAHPYVGAGIVTAVGVLALGAIWEVVEWGADGALGTDYSQGYADTLSDLLADAIAAAVGGVVVAIWQRARAQATRAERSPASAGHRYRGAA